MKKTIVLQLVILGCVCFNCKKKHHNDPPPGPNLDPKATISAAVADSAFNGYQAEKNNNLGFTFKVLANPGSITIGTEWPPQNGTFVLGARDPFNGKYYYASFIDGNNVEYRTKNYSGSLTVSQVSIQNNDVTLFKGSFSFTAYSANGDSVLISDGSIRYHE